jgi:hypothetical protein
MLVKLHKVSVVGNDKLRVELRITEKTYTQIVNGSRLGPFITQLLQLHEVVEMREIGGRLPMVKGERCIDVVLQHNRTVYDAILRGEKAIARRAEMLRAGAEAVVKYHLG